MVSMISRHSDPSGTTSSDPDIRLAYRSITQHGSLDWLALTYGKWSPGLRLSAAGSQGLSELKQYIAQSEQSVFLAFCRIPLDNASSFATITYIPEGTSSLRKARTAMSSRTVQSWFRGPQATLTVSRLEDLTVGAILDAMPSPPSVSVSVPLPLPVSAPVSSAFPSIDSAPASAIVRSSSEAKQDREKALPAAPGPVTRTVSEPARYVSMRGPPNFGDPRTRSEQREAQRRRADAEVRATLREEAARQAQIKAQQAEEAQQAEDAERTRRERLERDLARKKAVRMAQEEAERVEEERLAREREERRRRGAEKRAETTRMLQEWKLEEENRRKELARAEEELKRKATARREAARTSATKRRRESRMAGEGPGPLEAGWVTVQNSGSVAWRRRYFQLTDTVLRLYKHEKDVGGVPSDVIVLKGAEPTIKEWYEGFEELRSIPHAFALVFGNGEPPVMLFSDTAQEKDLLSGLLMTCPDI
ncbi:hypothetical protein F5148DRAFT_1373836 [Russula earlei]|uniref:Uncharacterized protein n=1 Tax=Russula earlei TaxID=71964 RepID=A0ACC0UIC5_9AGAM|nr:hypothetical protein F5148DRAFT_1373836 [Russula earlei]